MITQEQAELLMAKKIADELTDEENQLLQQWLDSDVNKLNEFKDYRKMWDHAQQSGRPNIDVDQAWGKVSQQLSGTKRFSLLTSSYARIAAGLIAALTIGLWFYAKPTVKWSEATTASNQVKKITLPDGSIAWIHEFSTIKFHGDFSGNSRKVVLSGLAFFDVVKNPDKPFVIETPRGEVRVLGTSFEVSAYPKDSFERVTVNTGKVQFKSGSANAVTLLAFQQAVITKKNEVLVTDFDSSHKVTWQTGTLEFSNDRMDKVAEKLERYYHVKVTFTNPNIIHCHFTGAFKQQSLNNVMNAMSKALQFTYEIIGNTVVVSGKGCSSTSSNHP